MVHYRSISKLTVIILQPLYLRSSSFSLSLPPYFPPSYSHCFHIILSHPSDHPPLELSPSFWHSSPSPFASAIPIVHYLFLSSLHWHSTPQLGTLHFTPFVTAIAFSIPSYQTFPPLFPFLVPFTALPHLFSSCAMTSIPEPSSVVSAPSLPFPR